MMSAGFAGFLYSWWESEPALPQPGLTVDRHPIRRTVAARPPTTGMANANTALLDSLVALRSDGSLVVSRGVPD